MLFTNMMQSRERLKQLGEIEKVTYGIARLASSHVIRVRFAHAWRGLDFIRCVQIRACNMSVNFKAMH